jgi:hypothetical protein
MPTKAENLATWSTLRAHLRDADQKATEAQLVVNKAYRECYLGRGAGPTDAELEEVERLRRVMSSLNMQMDAFVHGCLKTATAG